MYVACAQTWSRKYFKSTHTRKPRTTWPEQPKYKIKIKNKQKKFSSFSFLQ